MYPQTYSVLSSTLENAYVQLRLSSFSHDSIPHVSTDPARTQVVFMFDDGWASVYEEAYLLLNEYGYKGSIACIPGLVGENEYSSYAQLAEMYIAGWDILNHSYSHKENMYFQCDELLYDYILAREWLGRHYFTKGMNSVIVPYGECNPYMIPLLMDSGFDSIRTSDNILFLKHNEAAYFPVKTIHLLTDVSSDAVISELAAYAGGNTAILFNLHKMGEGIDRTQMTFSPKKLEAIVEYLHANEDKFQVLTYSSMLANEAYSMG